MGQKLQACNSCKQCYGSCSLPPTSNLHVTAGRGRIQQRLIWKDGIKADSRPVIQSLPETYKELLIYQRHTAGAPMMHAEGQRRRERGPESIAAQHSLTHFFFLSWPWNVFAATPTGPDHNAALDALRLRLHAVGLPLRSQLCFSQRLPHVNFLRFAGCAFNSTVLMLEGHKDGSTS